MQQQKIMQAEGFTQIISYVLVLVAAVEGAAWAAFGVSFWSKTVFIAWAVAMVWTRPWLVNTRILALAHGNEKLAASSATWLRVSLAITAFSLFSLYSESMESYKAQRIAESAPVLAATSRLGQAQAGLQRIKEGARFNDGEIVAAVADNTRLQGELQAAKAKAQAAFAAQKSAVQDELAAFWQSQHGNGFRYEELLDARCNPLRTRYGPMKSAAAELCPKLQGIQRKMPDVSSDPDVQRIESEITKLAPAMNLYKSTEAAKLAVSQAEEELHDRQSKSGVSHGADVYPPVFHRLANLTGNNVTADNLVSVFGILGILLLLFSLNLFQEARLLCMQDADGHIRQDAATEAQSWLSRLMFWRQDKPATVTPAPVSATAQMQAPAPAAVAPTVPTVDMPPAQPQDDSGSRFGFMGAVGGLKATAAKTEPAEKNCRNCKNLLAIGGACFCGLDFIQGEFTERQSKMQFCELFTVRAKNTGGTGNTGRADSTGAADRTPPPETVTQTKIVFRDRDRVPPELSQTGGPGRAGKIDNCIDCGSDFEVLVHNALRCQVCAEARQNKGRSIYQRKKKSEEKAI